MAAVRSLCLALLLGGLLAGCATRYQSAGFTGGHAQMAGPGKLEKVSFYGNGYTSTEKVQKFALYRCAEVAQSQGKANFILYDSLFNAARDRSSGLPRVGFAGTKPVAFAFMLTLDAPRYGSLETQTVLKELESFVKEMSRDAPTDTQGDKKATP
jgi:hypothetical protein